MRNEFVLAHVTPSRTRAFAASPALALSYANNPSHGPTSEISASVTFEGVPESATAVISRAPTAYAVADARAADDEWRNSIVETSASTNGGPMAVRSAAVETLAMCARTHSASASARASARRRVMVCGRTMVGEWDGLKKSAETRGARHRRANVGEWASVGVRIVQIIILLVNLHITAHLVHEIGFGVVDSGDVSCAPPRVG